jgi:hypothetical protein
VLDTLVFAGHEAGMLPFERRLEELMRGSDARLESTHELRAAMD